jgi:microcystin-dependent protein
MNLRKLNTPALALSALALAASMQSAPAAAQEAMLGEIKCFGGNFAPRGWALLDGQLLAINQFSALFAILGTTYGGDGRTTFALPDMRGRVLVHAGNGPGLAQRRLGERGGSETNTLSQTQLPAHAHPHTHEVAPLGASSDATSNDPQGRVPAKKARTTLYADPDTTPGSSNLVEQAATVTREGGTTPSGGGGQAVNNMQPYVAVNCMIALQGVFPSRN